MRISDNYGFIDIEIVEVCTEYELSTCCSVRASGEGFNGELKRVWFSQEKLDNFLAELQVLEEKRHGTATLLNMSSLSEYSPLHFQISSTSVTRDFTAKADLLKINYIGDEPQPFKLSVCFTIAQEMLPSLLTEFRRLFHLDLTQ